MLFAPPLSEGAPEWLRNFPTTREAFDALGAEGQIMLLLSDLGVKDENDEVVLAIHLQELVEALGAREEEDETPAREAHPSLDSYRALLSRVYRKMSDETTFDSGRLRINNASVEWSEGAGDFIQNLPMQVAAARKEAGRAALDALEAKLTELERTTNVSDSATVLNLMMIHFRLLLLETNVKKEAAYDVFLQARVTVWKGRLYGILARQFDEQQAEPLPPPPQPARPASETPPGAVELSGPAQDSRPAETAVRAVSTEPAPSLLSILSEHRRKVIAAVAALLLAGAGASYVAATKSPDQTFGERVEQMERNLSRWVDRRLGEDPSEKKFKKSKKKPQ